MLNYAIVFFAFSVLTVLFRFVIGNPVTSSRFQTKFKFISVPAFLSIILFFNISKKPVSIHVIAYQLLNYFLFIILSAFSLNNQISIRLYFTIEYFLCLFVIIVPLFVETIIGMIRGLKWKTSDSRAELSFEEYEMSFVSENSIKVLKFGIFINNRIIFYDEGNIIGEGIINYKKQKLFIFHMDFDIPCLQNFNNIILLKHKLTEKM